MRKAQKQEMLEFINSLHQAHIEIRGALNQRNYDIAQNMLGECQEFAVTLGENIEKIEGEGHITVSRVEEYCETLFRVFKEITDGQVNENKIYKMLRRQLLAVENSVKNDILVRKEVVFFPYKASMWDCLESIYLAAKEDSECDAYCVPIPYFDMNPDRSFGEMHYEGDEYPADIEIISWEKYNFEDRRPDAVYIHNPYDDYNLMTSVHPRYYSANLKKYTDTLVYIPYYVTSGGMLEGQGLLPAYRQADYIVIQSPQFRKYIDKEIPNDKLLPFGSPKIDKVISQCKNPPEPSAEWRQKMTGKDGKRRRVFFYNISIKGMLADTENFLKKIEYVFQCFEGREDVCLLWRPHPLLEAAFDSMRPEYRRDYEALKKYFLEKELGIFDTTSDIAGSIALSDAYIGDAGTSIISLFGIVGKPMFILDNRIQGKSGKDGWSDKISMRFNPLEQDRFMIIQGNQLYISEEGKYDYHFFCTLSKRKGKRYFRVFEVNGEKYIFSENTQEILKIETNGVKKIISLKKETVRGHAFIDVWRYDRFLVLQPFNYPFIVRYDTVTEECRYFAEQIDVRVKDKDGKRISGGSWLYQGVLYITSPVDNVVFKLNIESGETDLITIPVRSRYGWNMLDEYMDEIWMMPYEERSIVRWNPKTGETKEYRGFPKEFICVNPQLQQECKEQPFSSVAFYKDEMYLAPRWANMYLRLNIRTGKFTKWDPPFEDSKEGNGAIWNRTFFLQSQPEDERGWIKIYSNVGKKLYHFNMETNECKEIEMKFDVKELEEQEPGFGECSETVKYACAESIFNSLDRFIEGTTLGSPFDKKKQLEIYSELASNSDGSSGKKIYKYIKSNE